MTPDIEGAATAYGRFFETLEPATLDDLRELAAPEMRFKDPFNDVRGIDRVIRVLAQGFEDATDLKFRMQHQACCDQVCYLHWTFTCTPRRFLRDLEIEGVTAVRFDAAGRVVEHIDHWDAGSQFYQRLPLIGPVLRWLGRRLAVRD